MTEPLSFGVEVNSFSEEQKSSSVISATSSAASLSSSSSVLNSTASNDVSLVEDLSNVYADSVIEEETKQSSSEKPKLEENQVPKLIDNKRKHLEKTWSPAQRDQLLLQEAKDNAQFRKTLTETLQESNRVSAESLHGIFQSMADLGNDFLRSMQMSTQAIIMQSQPPVPRNMFFWFVKLV